MRDLEAQSPRELETLIAAALDGELSPEDAARLRHLLSQSRFNQQVYLEQAMMYSMLKWRGGTASLTGLDNLDPAAVAEILASILAAQDAMREREFELEPDEIRHRRSWAQSGWRVIKYSLAIGACLLLFFGWKHWQKKTPYTPAIVAPQPQRVPPPAPVALLVDAKSVVWAQPNRPAAQGDAFFPGHYVLKHGLVELKFASGATTIFEAPSEFRISNGNSIDLIAGAVACNVPKEAIGFSVRSSSVSIVDLGTQFSVVALSDSSGELHVLEGKVAIAHDEVPEPQIVTQTQARHISAHGQKITPHPFNANKVVRSFDHLIAWDNFNNKNAHQSGLGWSSRWFPPPQEQQIHVFNGREASCLPGNTQSVRVLTKPIRNQTLYFSGHFRIDGNDPVCSSWIRLSRFCPGTGQFLQRDAAAIGISDNRFAAVLADSQALSEDTTGGDRWHFGTVEPGRQYFIVGKLELNARGQGATLSVWVDPPVDTPGPPDRVESHGFAIDSIGYVSLVNWQVDPTAAATIDNLRVGTTWHAVQ